MNITQLKCIYEIAKEKNLSRAAEKNYISQSSLSQYLSKLEFELGVQLFYRKKWEPTEAGQIYLNAAKTIIELHEHALKEINTLVTTEKNTIRLGMSSERAAMILPQVYESFHKTCPNVMIALREDHALTLQQMAAANEIDLAFTVLPFPHQTELLERLNCISVYTEDLVLIVPVNHHFVREISHKAEQAIPLERLSGESFICHHKAKALQNLLDHVFDLYHIVPRQILECASTATCIEFVSANIGISIVPKLLVEKLQSVRIVPTEPQLSWQLGASYAKDKKLSAAEHQLITYMKEAFVACGRN